MIDSMTTQRIAALNQRLTRVMARMAEVHPDAPEAEDLQTELDELMAQQAKIVLQFPLRFRVFIWCCRTMGEMLSPFVRGGYRLFHMLKGLM